MIELCLKMVIYYKRTSNTLQTHFTRTSKTPQLHLKRLSNARNASQKHFKRTSNVDQTNLKRTSSAFQTHFKRTSKVPQPKLQRKRTQTHARTQGGVDDRVVNGYMGSLSELPEGPHPSRLGLPHRCAVWAVTRAAAWQVHAKPPLTVRTDPNPCQVTATFPKSIVYGPFIRTCTHSLRLSQVACMAGYLGRLLTVARGIFLWLFLKFYLVVDVVCTWFAQWCMCVFAHSCLPLLQAACVFAEMTTTLVPMHQNPKVSLVVIADAWVGLAASKSNGRQVLSNALLP